MSSAVKKVVAILMMLVVFLLGFGIITFMDKKDLEQQRATLQGQLGDAQDQIAKRNNDISKLKGDINNKENEIANLTRKLSDSQARANDLMGQVDSVTKDLDKFKKRADTIANERDKLLDKVQDLVRENDDLMQDLEDAIAKAQRVSDDQPAVVETESGTRSLVSGSNNEAYWAQVLKDKASLEIKIKELEMELSENSLEIVGLTQSKTELEIEVDTVIHAKEDLEREIAHQEGLINNLSLELARAKNDKKFVSDRSKKLNEENTDLRKNLKMLASTKGALERSIVRLTQDKDQIESQLGQTETIIQSKIDEIWEIKDSIDKTIRGTAAVSSSNDVELPPIIVSSNGPGVSFNSGMSHPGLSGKVVSVNEENNFLIVDLGENSGIRVGDKLSVYRESKYLASLEVIQVRKDISAANIKDQWTKLQVGDVVQ